jgi:homoaconitate hydratase
MLVGWLAAPPARPSCQRVEHLHWSSPTPCCGLSPGRQVGITDMYKKFGKPGVFDKERVWLAVDHTVDPRIYDQPKPTALIRLSDEFAAETDITDYWPKNTTIMHTEFARQRAQPGQIVIGADSHTCSAGGMGAFACGLGAADVAVPLVTGQTWFQVPETVLIEFVGAPRFGVGGECS